MLCSSFSSSKTRSSSSSSTSSLPIQHHILSQSMMEEKIEHAESIITKWAPNASSYAKNSYLFKHNRVEAKEFIKRIRDMCHAMNFLVSENSASDKLILAQKLTQVAMKRLEKEFYQILSNNCKYLDSDAIPSPSSNSSNFYDGSKDKLEDELKLVGEPMTVLERVSGLAISDLKVVADCMISFGYGKECVKIHTLMRKSIVDEGLYHLGIERFKSSHIHGMKWEAREHFIKIWLNAITIAVKTLFTRERILCNHVFSASDTIKESCYSEIVKEGAINLFRFPKLIAESKHWSGKIFWLLEIYEAISSLWPEIELISRPESTSAIKLQALSSLEKLGDSVRTILSAFETRIQKDSSKTPVVGGGIHPMTEWVMDYIVSLAYFSEILSDIIAYDPPPQSSLISESYFKSPKYKDGSTPAVSIHLAWLILVLLCKLDSKAEQYKDVSLSYLFLANNFHFIVEKVQTTKLKNLLGKDWVSEHKRKVKQYVFNYESTAWTKVKASFPEDNYPAIPPEAAKEGFRRFNSAFEEEYLKQMSWIVPDGKLRDEIKVSIAKNLVPAYRKIYATYSGMSRGEKNLFSLVRLGPDDLRDYLSDLFNRTSISGRSSLYSSENSRE